MNYLQLLINGLSLGSVYALISLGFTLIYSVLKFSNFSHGGVMVTSAYFGYIIAKNYGLGLAETLAVTAIFGGVVSAACQVIGFERLRRNNGEIMLFFVASSTLGTLLQNLMAIRFSNNYYSYPTFFKKAYFEFGNFTLTVTDSIMLAISALLIVVLMIVLYKTRLGVSIRALSMDSSTARLMGINVSLVVFMCFFMSGMLGAIAGVFLGIRYVLYPQLSNMVFKGMTASIIGGLGNISGALYGGLLLGVTEVFLVYIFGSGYSTVVIFFLTVFFLIWRPQGIAGKFTYEKV
ncbi:MAG: branched-chain amino acid ABC transporter permease [Candidatus Pelethousia sp.]|nr:branched-chain amino acid ABC transporter permease [Candidatus Pelethousia sp.]